MEGQINPKIVGATILGFAFIFGAYVISSINKPIELPQQASVAQVKVPPRVSIEVVDNNQNGIEDWRDAFITTPPVYLDDQNDGPYVPPDTLTGQTSINLLESFIRAKSNGPFGSSKEELLDKTVTSMAAATEQKLYDMADIDIMEEWDDEDIVNYANTLAATLARHNIQDAEQELFILRDIANNQKVERVAELEAIANAYQNYRADTLKIPVPKIFAKEHLDLINTYEAVFTDISAMAAYLKDPARTLLRLKRYEDDATGLSMALTNMFTVLMPYAHLFTVEDPAAIFVLFSPYYQSNQ